MYGGLCIGFEAPYQKSVTNLQIHTDTLSQTAFICLDWQLGCPIDYLQKTVLPLLLVQCSGASYRFSYVLLTTVFGHKVLISCCILQCIDIKQDFQHHNIVISASAKDGKMEENGYQQRRSKKHHLHTRRCCCCFCCCCCFVCSTNCCCQKIKQGAHLMKLNGELWKVGRNSWKTENSCRPMFTDTEL